MTTTPNVPGGEMPPGTQPPGEIPATPPGTGEIPATTQTQASSIDAALKEIERLKSDLKKVHNESAGHRKKADELDKLKADQEAASLTELQKLQKQLTVLQAEKERATLAAQEARVGAVLQVQALQHGIDPTLAHKLIDRADLLYDDAGNPTNVEALLKALTKQYPTLVGKPSAPVSGGATNPARSQSSGLDRITREFVETMTAEQYNALSPTQRAQVQEVIQNGRSPFGQRNKH